MRWVRAHNHSPKTKNLSHKTRTFVSLSARLKQSQPPLPSACQPYRFGAASGRIGLIQAESFCQWTIFTLTVPEPRAPVELPESAEVTRELSGCCHSNGSCGASRRSSVTPTKHFLRNERKKRNNGDQNECQPFGRFSLSRKCSSPGSGQTPSVPCTP